MDDFLTKHEGKIMATSGIIVIILLSIMVGCVIYMTVTECEYAIVLT